MNQGNKLSRYKSETLLKRLEKYDEQYYLAIMTPKRGDEWGYAMRSYYAQKVANPPEWKIKDKAIALVEELNRRGVSYSTTYLML